MTAFDEEYTKWTTKNVSGKGISERFLWLGTAPAIGLLAALLLGLSGALEPDSVNFFEDCAAKTILGC
jgi:hypothetical protein